MDHENWLPLDVRQLIADFGGLKPAAHVNLAALDRVGESYFQDRCWDMIWSREYTPRGELSPWMYRWVGEVPRVFKPGRCVWPKRDSQWDYRLVHYPQCAIGNLEYPTPAVSTS